MREYVLTYSRRPPPAQLPPASPGDSGRTLQGSPAGAALVGVGLIALGVQGVRKVRGFALDGFALTVGALFVAAGILQSIDASLGLVPLLCIGVGVLLLMVAIAGRPRASGRGAGSSASPTRGRA